jgi:hypothetical protein
MSLPRRLETGAEAAPKSVPEWLCSQGGDAAWAWYSMSAIGLSGHPVVEIHLSEICSQGTKTTNSFPSTWGVRLILLLEQVSWEANMDNTTLLIIILIVLILIGGGWYGRGRWF